MNKVAICTSSTPTKAHRWTRWFLLLCGTSDQKQTTGNPRKALYSRWCRISASSILLPAPLPIRTDSSRRAEFSFVACPINIIQSVVLLSTGKQTHHKKDKPVILLHKGHMNRSNRHKTTTGKLNGVKSENGSVSEFHRRTIGPSDVSYH